MDALVSVLSFHSEDMFILFPNDFELMSLREGVDCDVHHAFNLWFRVDVMS